MNQTIDPPANKNPKLNETYGSPELCTWNVGAGSCRFQTNDPRIARKLSKRSGAQLTAWSVNCGYLRIFQERISPRLARKLVNRYLKVNEQPIKATNARFLGLQGSPSGRKAAVVS